MKEGSYSKSNAGDNPAELQNKQGVDPTPLDVLRQFNDLEDLVDVINNHLSTEEYQLAKSWRSEARTDTTVVDEDIDLDTIINDDSVLPVTNEDTRDAVAAAEVFDIKRGPKPVASEDEYDQAEEIAVRRIKHPLLQSFLNNLVSKVDWTVYDPPLYRNEWSRVVRPALKRKKHVIIDVCHPSGVLARHTVTKANAFAIPGFYKGLRKVDWGGMFPALGIVDAVDENVDPRAIAAEQGRAPRLGQSKPSGLALEAAGRRKERRHKEELQEKRTSKKKHQLEGTKDREKTSKGDNLLEGNAKLDNDDHDGFFDDDADVQEDVIVDPRVSTKKVSSFDESEVEEFFRKDFKPFRAEDYGIIDDDDMDDDMEGEETAPKSRKSSTKASGKSASDKKGTPKIEGKSIRDLRSERVKVDERVDYIRVEDSTSRRRVAPTRRKPAPAQATSETNSDSQPEN